MIRSRSVLRPMVNGVWSSMMVRCSDSCMKTSSGNPEGPPTGSVEEEVADIVVGV